ncbi:MAG TPA: hypothetical protein PLP34_04540 [Chitinophagaceae bacterium]|nr:hypothetical protein [Chitinophagaceae bacterium]
MKQRLLRLEEENQSLKQSVFKYLSEIEQLKKQMKEVQAEQHTRSIPASSRKKILQKEIDQYILLIDKCMATIQTHL